MAVWICGAISGGHINPAVTLALAVWRDFPWRKVPSYIFAQVLGAFVGAAIVYGNYFHAIDIYEGQGIRTLKTANLFASYPVSLHLFFQKASSSPCCTLAPIHDQHFSFLL
jgi:aquaglyceroporin related protein, other eukaryote